MALYKEIKEENGVVTCYHRIQDFRIHTGNVKQAIVTVGSYVDAETRKNGIPYTAAESVYALPIGDELNELPIRTCLYTALKATERFEGASDA